MVYIERIKLKRFKSFRYEDIPIDTELLYRQLGIKP